MIPDILCMLPREIIIHYPTTSSDPLNDCLLHIWRPLNWFQRSSELNFRHQESKTKPNVKNRNVKTKLRYCPIVSQTTTTFYLPMKMAEEINFQIGHFRIFRGLVTLTSTSDDLENHIVENDKSTCINIRQTMCCNATMRLWPKTHSASAAFGSNCVFIIIAILSLSPCTSWYTAVYLIVFRWKGTGWRWRW